MGGGAERRRRTGGEICESNFRLLNNTLAFDNIVQRKGVQLCSKCVYCDNSESLDHCLLFCHAADKVWSFFNRFMGIGNHGNGSLSLRLNFLWLQSGNSLFGRLCAILPSFILSPPWHPPELSAPPLSLSASPLSPPARPSVSACPSSLVRLRPLSPPAHLSVSAFPSKPVRLRLSAPPPILSALHCLRLRLSDPPLSLSDPPLSLSDPPVSLRLFAPPFRLSASLRLRLSDPPLSLSDPPVSLRLFAPPFRLSTAPACQSVRLRLSAPPVHLCLLVTDSVRGKPRLLPARQSFLASPPNIGRRETAALPPHQFW